MVDICMIQRMNELQIFAQLCLILILEYHPPIPKWSHLLQFAWDFAHFYDKLISNETSYLFNYSISQG